VALCAASAVTISGISSGAAFAVQFHVAHSSVVAGAGIIAGAPYWCAEGNMVIALSNCMASPNSISIAQLVSATGYAYATGTIDDPSNLKKSKVYLYSGKNDTVVNPGVVKKLHSYYQTYIPSANIETEYDIPSEHSFVTNSYGSNCSYLGSPFINNCDYDAAGAIFHQLLGNLNAPVPAIPGNIQTLKQAQFLPPFVLPYAAAIGTDAYLYVPTACQHTKGCAVHAAFHGCEQNIDLINTTFITHAGYNEWAEANNIIVLYPQAIATTVNPKGCWDWWGFTGLGYASQLGPQIITVKNMIDYITQHF